MADRAAQQAEAVAGQPYEALRKQVIANLEGLARPCGAVPALRETVAAYQQYKLDIAGMGGAFGVVVANGLAALVAAYARCVAIDMYYLRQEDLEVLADRDVKGLIIYQEHDLHPGRYREYLVYEAARGAGIIRVFHSGAHYELVTMDG